MIEAKNLTKKFGAIVAVSDVSFIAAPGEILGFLGPNAAGKTTTMRILTGYSPATSGTAIVAGFDVHEDPYSVKQRVGYLPENVPLYTEMTVSSYLRYVAEVKRVPRGRRMAEADRVMERCGLSHMAPRILGNLSKGYRQRVGLAQALLGNPPVLILDEPTVGLDPKQIVDIRRTIRDLAADHTVLLSTHILPEVSMVCDKVLIINRGRVVAQDTMANLEGDSRTPEYEVEVGGDTETTLTVLAGIPGVQGASRTGNDLYRLECNKGVGPLASAIAEHVGKAGLTLLGVRKRTRSLEEIFISAISEDGSSSVADGVLE